MDNTQQPIIIETEFYNSKGEVWSAITELEEMRQWYFDILPSFKAEVGFETSFLVQVEDRKYTHLWKIIEVEPFKKISYEWRFEEVSGLGLVTFEIIENDGHVRLVLTNEDLQSFPKDVPEFTEESCRNGWNYFIKERLANYLKKS